MAIFETSIYTYSCIDVYNSTEDAIFRHQSYVSWMLLFLFGVNKAFETKIANVLLK